MTENIKVVISSDFLTSFARLPRQIQGKVTEFVNKFRNNPLSPGINYEKINSGVDKKIYSVRIDDTYRGIVVRQEETGVYLLLWVDHHDEAYQFLLPETSYRQISTNFTSSCAGIIFTGICSIVPRLITGLSYS